MRVVAVSMVKNEADVVEAFVRHTASFADHHLIFDHASTDGTRFVLRKLQREGLSLTLLTDDRVEYLQAERTTELMRRAVRDHAADWVLPLDADEFPQAADPAALRKLLAGSGRPVRLWLRDHAPHPADDPTEPNPALRLRHTLPHKTAGKVFVPRALAADPACALAPGNHELLRNGTRVERDQQEDVWLAHFACRSAGQIVGKIVLNELQRLAGGAAGGGGTHLRPFFDRLLASPKTFVDNPGAYLAGVDLAPAAYWGRPLRYPAPVGEWERATVGLLAFGEQLAASHGRLKDAQRPGWRSWFRRKPASPMREGLAVPDSRTATPAGCELAVLSAEIEATEVRFAVRVRNAGLCLWRAGAVGEVGTVHLGVQLCVDGKVVDPGYRRWPLPADLEPGDAVTLSVAVPRPADPAATFRLDLVAEGVAWFDFPGCVVNVPALPARQAA
jgi:hypothetical protein